MRYFRSLLFIFLTVLISFFLIRLYYNLTDDFRLGNITYEKTPEVNIASLSKDRLLIIQSILNQPFYYLGKGAQSYVFGSEDDQYVLKFFKFKHLKPEWYVTYIPSVGPLSQLKIRILERKLRKINSVFKGYEVAYKENNDAAQIIFLHLKPTNHLHQFVKVVDKMGFTRTINLDHVIFLLQRKGETAKTYIGKQLANNSVDLAKRSFSQIIDMYLSEYKKGLYDRDHGVMHNTGFVEGQPFHLDVGFLTKDIKMKTVNGFKDDFSYVIFKMQKWVKASFPHYEESLSRYLADQYYIHTGLIYDASNVNPKFHKIKKD